MTFARWLSEARLWRWLCKVIFARCLSCMWMLNEVGIENNVVVTDSFLCIDLCLDVFAYLRKFKWTDDFGFATLSLLPVLMTFARWLSEAWLWRWLYKVTFARWLSCMEVLNQVAVEKNVIQLSMFANWIDFAKWCLQGGFQKRDFEGDFTRWLLQGDLHVCECLTKLL